MQFSLKAMILVSTWVAWLVAAIASTHPLLVESFVVGQYLLVGVAFSVACFSNSNYRVLAGCFAAGFAAWLLYLFVENQFANSQTFRGTIPGARIHAVSAWLSDLKTFPSNSAKYKYILELGAIVRATMGILCGVLACALLTCFRRPNLHGSAQAEVRNVTSKG